MVHWGKVMMSYSWLSAPLVHCDCDDDGGVSDNSDDGDDGECDDDGGVSDDALMVGLTIS